MSKFCIKEITYKLKLIVLFILISWQYALPVYAASSPKFSDYPVKDIYRGPTKQPDFTNDDYIRFKVGGQVVDMNKGPNFAGHFTIMSGGCGTSCIFYIVVDHKNGKYYKTTDFIEISDEIKYKDNSRLLLVSHTEPLKDNRERCILGYYIWQGQSFKKLLKKDLGPTTNTNGHELVNCSIGE